MRNCRLFAVDKAAVSCVASFAQIDHSPSSWMRDGLRKCPWAGMGDDNYVANHENMFTIEALLFFVQYSLVATNHG
jgi:hypothetical protein